MSRLRFATAKDLFDAFPSAAGDIGVADAVDLRSIDFLRRLVQRRAFRAALSFCAYLLARREAVWWGAQAVRQSGELLPDESALLSAAETWVREPEEARRKQALDLGSRADTRLAGSWICLGAGWAGGTMKADADHHVPVPPQATAQAVRAGVILAADRLAADQRDPILTRWVEAGIELAEASGKR
jgi:hypothetical protein